MPLVCVFQRVRNSSYPNSTQDVNAFSAASLEDLLQEFSEMSMMHVAMGYLIMVSAAILDFYLFSGPVVSSQN